MLSVHSYVYLCVLCAWDQVAHDELVQSFQILAQDDNHTGLIAATELKKVMR